MTEPPSSETAPLHSALADFESAFEPSLAPIVAIERRSAQLKRRRRMLVALPAVAITAVAVVAIFPRLGDDSTSRDVASSPDISNTPDITSSPQSSTEVGTVGDDIAFDYEAACPDVNKAAGQCPLDDRGRALWEEVVAAFEHTLTPSQLSGALVAAGTTEYNFFAQIGTDQDEPPSASSDNNKGRRNQLWVRATVGSDAEPGEASIVVHPSDTEDFIFGEGTVTVTREDGIEMVIEFWGAPSAQATQHGAPDIISLFKRATAKLTAA